MCLELFQRVLGGVSAVPSTKGLVCTSLMESHMRQQCHQGNSAHEDTARVYSGLASEGLAVAASGPVPPCGWVTVPVSWVRRRDAEWRQSLALCPLVVSAEPSLFTESRLVSIHDSPALATEG